MPLKEASSASYARFLLQEPNPDDVVGKSSIICLGELVKETGSSVKEPDIENIVMDVEETNPVVIDREKCQKRACMVYIDRKY